MTKKDSTNLIAKDKLLERFNENRDRFNELHGKQVLLTELSQNATSRQRKQYDEMWNKYHNEATAILKENNDILNNDLLK